MAKIELNNIAHSYNPNDPNPIFALKEMSYHGQMEGVMLY